MIHIFTGTEPKTEIARKVLQCSILRRTEAEVEFTPMIGPGWEYPTAGIKVGTGFSLRRWMIPRHCGWQGRAIYLDADQIVLGDIKELWDKPETVPAPKGTSAWTTYQPDKFYREPAPQSSVMVIDCAAAAVSGKWGWRIDEVLGQLRANPSPGFYAGLMHATWMSPPPKQIGAEWNHLNAYKPGKTRLLHYTKEPEQPWYKPDHPLAEHWQTELAAAVQLGHVTPAEIEAAVANWGKQEDWRASNGMHPYYLRFAKAARVRGK